MKIIIAIKSNRAFFYRTDSGRGVISKYHGQEFISNFMCTIL